MTRFHENFLEFRSLAVKMITDVVKSTLAEDGFSYDDYKHELARVRMEREQLRLAHAQTHAGKTLSSTSCSDLSPSLAYNDTGPLEARDLPGMGAAPAKKLTFIEQANKRQCCFRIMAFVRLIDVVMRNALQHLIYNSMIEIKKNVLKRWSQEHLVCTIQVDAIAISRVILAGGASNGAHPRIR